MTTIVTVAAIGTLVLVAAAAANLVVQALRSRSARRTEQARLVWADRWIDVVFAGHEAPAGPLDQPAAESLLDLRESLDGEPAEVVDSLVRSYGIDAGLIRRLRQVRTARLDECISVLDGLGRARSSAAVPSLLIAATDPRRSARLMGIRALARSVAALGSDAERAAVAFSVARVMRNAKLSSTALGEAMELLGRAAPHVVGEVLPHPARWGDQMVATALDAVGRLELTQFTDQVVAFAASKTTKVRRAALHALTSLERLPASAAPIVLRAFRDTDESIRIEAALASHLLDKKTAISYLEDMLTDDDWTVRRAAATTLAGLGGPGVRTLIATSLVHGDDRARSMATQVLVSSRSAAELHQEREKVG
jgi:hypothetical protein